MGASNPFRLTWLLYTALVRGCYGLIVAAITILLAALASLPLVATAVAACFWFRDGTSDWIFVTYVVLFFFSGFYMKAWQAMTAFQEAPDRARPGGPGLRNPDTFAGYHRRLWTWSGRVLNAAVQYTSWWVGVSFVIWISVMTLAPVFFITNCIINARAGTSSLSDILSAIVFSAFAFPVIRLFPPTKVWGLIKDLGHGLPFILNISTLGLLRVVERQVKAAVTGLPANCEVRMVQTPQGLVWGVVQQKPGEIATKLIVTGASREDVRKKARKIMGIV